MDFGCGSSRAAAVCAPLERRDTACLMLEVVVDAPAMLAVSDAMIVAEAVDTRIYLTAADATPRTVVQDGLARLAEQRLPVAGTILNKVDIRKTHDPYAEGYGYDT